MSIVNDVLSATGSFAKGIGNGSASVARGIGNGTVDLARGFGSGTASVARAIGWKRALIGLAAIGAADGAAVLIVRVLRARGEDVADDEPTQLADGVSRRKARANRRKQQPAVQH